MAKSEFPRPDAMVDVVLMTVRDGELCVFLAKRDREPFKGAMALPGGYIHVDGPDENTEDTARRVLAEKVALTPPYLEQLKTFSGRTRDPRGWSLSVAYYALVPEATLTGTHGLDARIVPVSKLPGLPFDHRAMIDTAVERLRGKSEYSSLPFYLIGDEFTVTDLQVVYEQVLGEKQNASAFRRKMVERGLITAIPGRSTKRGTDRPAQLYRRNSKELILMKMPI